MSNQSIDDFIVKNVEKHPKDVVSLTAHQFGVSRQAVCKHIRTLVASGKIGFKGTTKNRTYFLKSESWSKKYQLNERLAEDSVWRNDVRPLLQDLPQNILDIWSFGFSEMLNNAIDHSEGTNVFIGVERDATQCVIFISDNGVGIFKKIQQALLLSEEHDAILELAKGKFTTDSKRHSGEGIFFTSRGVDLFSIFSGSIRFCYADTNQEYLVLGHDYLRDIKHEGTTVVLCVKNDCKRTMKSVYDQFTTDPDDSFGFDKTIIPVRLAQQGNDKLVSRSQAKRLLTRFDRFKIVVLDFEGVSEIGQAFADEVFRVFSNEHPQIKIVPVNVNASVQKMIRRTN